ncbi:MAG: hypothetical protein ABR588_05905 [Sphingomicrobium sp.]|nr:hypothetical protein [Sphingomonadales bacterium]
MFKRILIAVGATTAIASAVPASAQLTQQGGLVNVTIGDVTLLNNFLNNDQIAALNNLSVPITVQAPIGIAANVCGVSAAVLGKSTTGPATCTATSGSQALAQIVNRQMLSQKK